MEDLNRWAEVINDTMGKAKFNLQTLDEMKQRRTTKSNYVSRNRIRHKFQGEEQGR